MTLHSLIAHDGLWRMAEHLRHIQVERLHAVALYEREMGIASGFTHHIQWGTLALSNFPDMLDMLFVDEQTHAFLTLIGDNLLGGEGLVSDGQLGHVDATAAVFHQFG